MAAKEPTSFIGIQCPVVIHEWLKAYAEADSRSVTNLMIKILKEFKQREEAKRESESQNKTPTA